jgi:6-phosphogluconolactonase (cycloisomerase 2 family)
MKKAIRSLVVLAVVAAGVFAATPVQAANRPGPSGSTVFVQTNDPTGNSIDVFHRNGDGTLAFLKSYATGGAGGRESGATSDPLASQGSLALVPNAGLLLAVNAGSNTISVFDVSGDRLHLEQVLPSGGPFPTSLGVSGNLVYVLDAGLQGFVSGFRITGGGLHPIAGSTRTLGLANSNPPFFLSSPAEVGFTANGAHLVVTTKTNSTVDVFSVAADGRLSEAPVKNAAGPVPFAFVSIGGDRLLLNFAGNSSLQTITVNGDNTITPTSAQVPDGQVAACWITSARGFDYVSNTGSGDISQFQVSGSSVALVNPVAAANVNGAIDSGAAGGFLYVQAGSEGTVHVFAIGAGGALTAVQVVSVPDGASQEGIVAS